MVPMDHPASAQGLLRGRDLCYQLLLAAFRTVHELPLYHHVSWPGVAVAWPLAWPGVALAWPSVAVA